ncbi:hypothetical protein UCDDA912_g10225 [Diaporthe ampelina]|uniref:Uncharacterized protein n=1 Tax=Diaporthe ampelina TaxID=1214573 RepID=A0A0G2F6K2_9PEZI|nr:hypothetical protein UCDDA912_g10225 [Diaporthe ampelina]
MNSNSPQVVCGRPIAEIINGSGRRTSIRWDERSVRIMKQMLAHYQLTPTNLVTAVTATLDGTDSVFNLICRAINCWFPSSPQFHAVVHPRVRTKLVSVLRRLDAAGAIVIYRLPFGAGEAVYWPRATRAWSGAGWDGLHDPVEPIDPAVVAALGLVAGGGPIPRQVVEAAESVQALPFLGMSSVEPRCLTRPARPACPAAAAAAAAAPIANMDGMTAAEMMHGGDGNMNNNNNNNTNVNLETEVTDNDDTATQVTTASSVARLQQHIQALQTCLANASTNASRNANAHGTVPTQTRTQRRRASRKRLREGPYAALSGQR